MIYLVTGQKKLFNTLATDIQLSSIDALLAYFRPLDELELDLETEGYDPHTDSILSMQLGTFEDQFVIDWPSITKEEFAAIKELLESDKLILIQNAQFDLRFLMNAGIDIYNVYDTFLAECVLSTGYSSFERKVSLADLALKYCNVALDKTVRGEIHWRGLDTTVIRYGALDVKYLGKIKDCQLKAIKKHGLSKILDLENSVVRVFAKMSLDGIRLDVAKWTAVCDITEANTKELAEKLDAIVFADPKLAKFIPEAFSQNLFGFEERKLNINWASPAQKLAVLRTLGFDVDSVGDRVLQKYKSKHALVSTLIAYSKQNKLATAFGREFLNYVNKATGRVHSSFWQILSTGRISVSNPNLNQIPSKGDLAKSIRAAFIPDEGNKIIGGDYSSFELAIIAELSGDPLWINTLMSGKNLHTELCKVTFDIDDATVKTKFPPKPTLTYRDVQKTVDFGLAYGMSHFKLSDTIEVSEFEAKDIINKFFKAVPNVKALLDKLGEFGKKHGYITTPPPFKRIRWFTGWKGKNTPKDVLGSIERASKNTPIQGGCALLKLR